MKKRLMAVVLAVVVMLAMTACGEKGKEDVLSDLNSKVEKLSGYKAKATLTIKTGTEAQTYHVDILYKKPSFYKVSLENAGKGQSQIILRNKEGVFVLTPSLNKSFKFQSDWPLNSSQAYLYESLVKDILLDKNATFTAGEKTYTFQTKTNYQNSNLLPTQEIVLNKKDLAPKSVKLLDTDKNALVEVKFTEMKFNGKIDESNFDVKKNMTAAQKSGIPTLAQEDGSSVAVLYPSDSSLPEGVTLESEKQIQTENGERIILSYEGEKAFTLMEEKATVAETSVSIEANGELVDLGAAVGSMTTQSITWSVDGTDYLLASENLSQDEMIKIASSIGQTEGK